MLGDGIEHRLQFGRGAANDRENVTRRRLLLQRFGEIAVFRFQLVEQADVLDGNDGLIGEGLEQLDLRRGERAHLDATCGQSSNEFPLLTKGNRQVGAPAAGGHDLEIVPLR